MTESVEAAVAILQREDGRVLLAQRPQGKPWAGWWEFPGGKIESGETPLHALQRELHEELGIETVVADRWLTRRFDYPERRVKLRFFRVRQWRGEPHGCEGQPLTWQELENIGVGPLLPANAPIVDALRLAEVYAISHLQELGWKAFFVALEGALRDGLRLLQLREKQLDAVALENLAADVMAMCKPYGARVLLNGEATLARRAGLDGIHLTSSRLMALRERPQDMLCAASCHEAGELLRAAELGLDFVLLSPVMPTLSHPASAPLGWQKFSRMIAEYPLPVYALGGLQREDLRTAWAHGAHGIAMQRAVWRS